MPKLTIDGRPVEVPEGATVLDAARTLGVDIPTLCFLDGRPPQTSCMVCVVKVDGGRRLLPACATVARDGMRVESEADEVRAARRTALELLLGDHLGDCVAPCEAVCPAHLGIPAIIRQVASGRVEPGAATAEPCRSCPGHCEKACRRAAKDGAVAIRLLIRYAAAAGGPAPRPPDGKGTRPYSVHVGAVGEDEIDLYLGDASPAGRVEPAGGPDADFTPDEAQSEARRCLHCDCRRAGDCRLRELGAQYGAKPNRTRAPRRPFERHVHPQNIVYEPGKCIACGLCIEITKERAEPLGLTFIGRGFDVRVAVPFGRGLAEGLQRAADECVRACPTGALAFNEDVPERP